MTALATLGAVSCSEVSQEQPTTEPQEEQVVEAGYGRMAFDLSSEFDVTVSGGVTRATESNVYELPEELVPDIDELPLIITGSYADVDDDMIVKDYYNTYENVETYNTMEFDKAGNLVPPYLAAGDYMVTVKNDGVYGVVSSTNARFAGSHNFTIVARDEDDTATIAITLQNSIISLTATEAFQKYFAHGNGAYISVTSDEAGEDVLLEYEYKLDSGLVESTADNILFLEPETTLYLGGYGYRQVTEVDGRYTKEEFTRQAIGTTSVCTINHITVDAEGTGESQFNITFDDSIVKITENELELNPNIE